MFGENGWYDYNDKKEQISDMKKRCLEVKEWLYFIINKYNNSKENDSRTSIIFFTHGYFMSELIYSIMNITNKERLYKYNCGVSMLELDNGNNKIKVLNDIEHFDNLDYLKTSNKV